MKTMLKIVLLGGALLLASTSESRALPPRQHSISGVIAGIDYQTHTITLMVGKAADIVVIKGNPATTIADIEKVEIVFKDGVGFDSAKLIDSVKGLVGLR